jgi:hypothetical protein
MKKYFAVLILGLFLCYSCGETRDIEVSTGIKISDKTIVYALPLTTIKISIEVTKTITKKGIYAEFAEKFLHIKNVPLMDSQAWTVTNTKMETLTEADPLNYYTITYKTYPSNIDKLLSISDKGVILDFSKSYTNSLNQTIFSDKTDSISDPGILSAIITVKTDTFYKTILSDSSYRRIPVIKKQILTKTIEDEANEAAKLILKIRKSRIKLLRGKLTYPPDGESLKLDIEELDKLENTYLDMFTGIKFQEKRNFTYYVTPKKEQLNTDLCYFSSEKGIEPLPLPGNRLLTLQILKVNDLPPAISLPPAKTSNILYIRIPATVNAILKISDKSIASERLSVYQFGMIQGFPLK